MCDWIILPLAACCFHCCYYLKQLASSNINLSPSLPPSSHTGWLMPHALSLSLIQLHRSAYSHVVFRSSPSFIHFFCGWNMQPRSLLLSSTTTTTQNTHTKHPHKIWISSPRPTMTSTTTEGGHPPPRRGRNGESGLLLCRLYYCLVVSTTTTTTTTRHHLHW